jgi:p-hydroxybenzoate 3-monooxygenase
MAQVKKLKTQVGIIGAGPAGLLLSHLLHLNGISSIVLERQNRQYVEARIRAGVLEQGTVDILTEAGVGDRLAKEGLEHDGCEFNFLNMRRRTDFRELTGKAVTVYAQHEVVKDLIARRLKDKGELMFDVSFAAPKNFDTDKPSITFHKDGRPHELACDFIAGCDGFHGVSRATVKRDQITLHERVFPFAWLGILAAAPPSNEELIYAHHDDGFALLSMRSPEIIRAYIQCAPDEDIANWPDDVIWQHLHRRLENDSGWKLTEGPILEKGITPMRSFVAEPLRFGRMFLAGDAAHIVPPTGAKGLNLAAADIRVLSRALDQYYKTKNTDLIEAYSTTCLRRIWKAQYFSLWMTGMLHRFPTGSEFRANIQTAQLDYVTGSHAAATSLAENYVGLPFED